MRLITTFEVVKLTATKSWKDSTGKRRQRKRTFSQTLNPYNINALGMPKTRQEIYAELRIEINKWKLEKEPD